MGKKLDSRTKAEIGEHINLGKIPTVTEVLLGAKRNVDQFEWVHALPEVDRNRLQLAAQIALQARATIVTIQVAKGGWRLGLRPRVHNDSTIHFILLKKKGNLAALRDGLRNIDRHVKGLDFSGSITPPARKGETNRSVLRHGKAVTAEHRLGA